MVGGRGFISFLVHRIPPSKHRVTTVGRTGTWLYAEHVVCCDYSPTPLHYQKTQNPARGTSGKLREGASPRVIAFSRGSTTQPGRCSTPNERVTRVADTALCEPGFPSEMPSRWPNHLTPPPNREMKEPDYVYFGAVYPPRRGKSELPLHGMNMRDRPWPKAHNNKCATCTVGDCLSHFDSPPPQAVYTGWESWQS